MPGKRNASCAISYCYRGLVFTTNSDASGVCAELCSRGRSTGKEPRRSDSQNFHSRLYTAGKGKTQPTCISHLFFARHGIFTARASARVKTREDSLLWLYDECRVPLALARLQIEPMPRAERNRELLIFTPRVESRACICAYIYPLLTERR